MPRIKPKQPFYLLGNLILSETENALHERNIAIPAELPSLVAAICYPNFKPIYKFQQIALRDAKRASGKFWTKTPDQAAVVCEVIYEKLAATKTPTNTNKVLHFLLNHNCLIESHGKFYLASAIGKIKGTLLQDAQLLDKYISAYLGGGITAALVKKVRQALVEKGKQQSLCERESTNPIQ